MVSDKKSNSLINQKSPYLLQHAYNPINWYAWSDEAFEKAKKEDKPIFLSIGYSTCHWCHVMERESFEDDEVAELLNESFVAIKVDREERPDVDNIYMQVCQALTGSGGWPLTILMTTDKKPFFAGTYFPKTGLMSILKQISEAWSGKRQYIMDVSEQIYSSINKQNKVENKEFDPYLIREAFSNFVSEYDGKFGGFGSSPKFPTPHNLYFLLRYWYKTNDPEALEMVERTLDCMYKGGIFDHIGYGFSRYSTDSRWLVPHFEKMLYDNALLAIAYLEAYQVTGKQKYSDVANKIFSYILTEMTSSNGGFYSAEDADSEGEEGKFYVWTVDEIKDVLGKEDGDRYCKIYNITEKGNFEHKNIPNLISSDLTDDDIEFVNSVRSKVFDYRNKREHPYKDNKILTSWNGLMIAALAIGGRVLKNQHYIDNAEIAIKFIFNNLAREDGRLFARYREQEAAYPAYVDDYSFLIWALIELYETTFNPEYLQKAMNLNNDLIKYFWDSDGGGLYVYGSDSEQLITRPKEIYDGATPSGNSVSALNFLRLARLTGEYDLEDKAHQLLKAFSDTINRYPRAYSFALIALMFIEYGSKEIVIVSNKDKDEAKEMVDMINKEFRPFTVTILYSNECENIKKVNPDLANYEVIDGKTTAYVCQNFSCKAPVTDVKSLDEILMNR